MLVSYVMGPKKNSNQSFATSLLLQVANIQNNLGLLVDRGVTHTFANLGNLFPLKCLSVSPK